MGRKHTLIQLLVFGTAILASLAIAGGAIYEAAAPAPFQESGIAGRPRIGRLEAKIEIVLIEDLRCGACRFFTEKILPQIEKNYIEPGRAYCVVVPVSFTDASRPLANAALEVNRIAPERFLPYLHAIYSHFGHQQTGTEAVELIELAKEIGGIDIGRLRECIETNCFSSELDENLAWGERIMGNNFRTPALYINGIKTSTVSIDPIAKRIERLEKK